MEPRSIYAWAILRKNKIDANEIYKDTDIVLDKGESLVRVIISVDEKNSPKKKIKKQNKKSSR